MIDTNLIRKSNGAGSHDQIIHFINGTKRLIQGVMYIWENEMTHIVDYLGIEYIVNKSNVLFVERISRGGEGHVRRENVSGKVGAGGKGVGKSARRLGRPKGSTGKTRIERGGKKT